MRCQETSTQRHRFSCPSLCRYEGTGRSLSLKLLQQLREASSGQTANGGVSNADGSGARAGRLGGALREITLEEAIR